MEFKPMPKMARLSREVVITEKIDGTNASVYIEVLPQTGDGSSALVLPEDQATMIASCYAPDGSAYGIWAGSRTRWLGIHSDNFGFANWVKENHLELAALGPGHHFGEWWGYGIQRGYGLAKGDRRFSLFNVGRWADPKLSSFGTNNDLGWCPKCCYVVPTLYRGLMTDEVVNAAIGNLQQYGSKAAPGFMDPEGIVLYHTVANQLFKKTIKGDEAGKSREGQIAAAPKVRSPRDPNVGGRRKGLQPITFPDRRQSK